VTSAMTPGFSTVAVLDVHRARTCALVDGGRAALLEEDDDW